MSPSESRSAREAMEDSRTRVVRYVRDASQIPGIPPDAAKALERVSGEYVFRANDYYLGLIDWSDPADPIRQLVMPREEELLDFGELDASNEAANTVAKGAQHKYADTALLLVNNVCGAYCRYCFRKRLFMDDNDETTYNLDDAIEHIRNHAEISDVLLTGGDPFVTSTRKLRGILESLADIPHVQTIRLGTKMPAFNPFRVLGDPELPALFREIADSGVAIYVMAHFDHPRELTQEARDGIERLLDHHARVVNQCPLIRGVNDDAETLEELFAETTRLGMPQYYLFQCRPTAGNAAYDVPLARGWQLFEKARRGLSGLSRRARFSMSHATGKVEIVGMDERHFYMRYHRAKNPADEGRFMIFKRDDKALWLDDLEAVTLN